MNLLKQLGLAVSGIIMSVTPSLAYTNATTADLLNHLDDNGITIVYNGPRCNDGIDGAYQWTGLARRMVLCTNPDGVDANDHNTVRHETIHAIQHCKNTIYERPSNTPIMDPEKVIEYAQGVLTFEQINTIKRVYPPEVWLIELEAFTGAEVLSNDDLIKAFNNWCVMES